jgi:hypothetical protein
MRKVFKISLIIAATILVVPVACLAVWELRQLYYEPKKQEAMRFCEALAPKIELAQQKEGKYPQAIDPAWYEGMKVPQLIHLDHLYEARDNTYVLYFRNPGDLLDDLWGYQCGALQKCFWQNND